MPKRSIFEVLEDRDIEWTDENTLDPHMTAHMSHKSAQFKCKEGHTWKASIQSVAGGSGCPHCYKASRTWSYEKIRQLTV